MITTNIYRAVEGAVIRNRRAVVTIIHLLDAAAANYLAFVIRFESILKPAHLKVFFFYLPYLLVIRVGLYLFFGLHKDLWRYSSVSDLTKIVKSVSLGTVLFVLVVRYLMGDASYPRSIYAIDWLILIMLAGGSRLFIRIFKEYTQSHASGKRSVIVGAGDAGEMLLRDIERNPAYPYTVIGFVDDDVRKKGVRIRDIPVLGTRKDLKEVIEREKPDEFIIAIPSATREQFEELVRDLRQYALPIKSVPSFWSILSGRASLHSIRAVEPEDILFRAPITGLCEKVHEFYRGKRIMITGAGGSIGSEIARQIATCEPRMLVLFERHEENLYRIDMELNGAHGEASKRREVHAVIGDVLDAARVSEVFGQFRPEVVLHAAAYKHVPLMESNPREAFRTNVLGTRLISQAAMEYGAERFVLISTDKAVNPSNVMGRTKKIAETIVRHDAEVAQGGKSGTKIMTVRFGNVLESSGSVVPLFNEQIKSGGPVTVTHPEIIRYFMTIPEAVSLVLQAAVMGEGGEVFVLDMGEPVKILDLANRMISLYGYRPGVDMEIVFIGLRPGEKLYEELFNSDEIVHKTAHPKINRAMPQRGVDRQLVEMIDNADLSRDPSLIMRILAPPG